MSSRRNSLNAGLTLPFLTSKLHFIAKSPRTMLDACECKQVRTKQNSVALVRERPSDLRISTKSVSTFADRGCPAISAADPYGGSLGFLAQSRNFPFQVAPQLYSRGEWIPFQTHYFSENLVAPGIELGPLDL
jgi:hypothetical protein